MNPPSIDVAAVPPLLLGNDAADHDDWEYEYDEEETEDIYFTLDLTTHVPNALVQKQFFTVPASNTNDGSSSIVQITDLHTDHPLVRLDDGVYDCTWTTDLGTQFHISEAGVIDRPHRPGTVLDVIGTSQTRLLGRPVELQPRSDLSKPISGGNNSGDAIMVDDENDSEAEREDLPEPSSPGLQAAPGQKLHIPRELCKDSAGQAQASFLERLSEIKLRKGEKDVIPIYGVRSYDPPSNANELREEGLAADGERARMSKDQQLAATSQRPQKRRRRPTYAEKGKATKSAERKNVKPSGRRKRRSTNESTGVQPEQSELSTPEANGAEDTQMEDIAPESPTSKSGNGDTSDEEDTPRSQPRPQRTPSEYVDTAYVAAHPNETFHHRGKGNWARGLPPPGTNPRMKTAVRGPGAKEWSTRVGTQKQVEHESESEHESD